MGKFKAKATTTKDAPDNEDAVPGHNSGPTLIAKDLLKSVVERVERLEEEKKASADDIRDVFSEAKGYGFDVKALRKIIALRKLDPDERRTQTAVVETYLTVLGMAD